MTGRGLQLEAGKGTARPEEMLYKLIIKSSHLNPVSMLFILNNHTTIGQ